MCGKFDVGNGKKKRRTIQLNFTLAEKQSQRKDYLGN